MISSVTPRRLAVRRPFALLFACALLLALLVALVPFRAAHSAGASLAGLHIVGNKLVNGSGQTVRLLGVNRSSTEYACV